MLNLYVIVVILCIINANAQTEDLKGDDFMTFEEQMKIEDRIKAYKVRCTRRFTPGVCLESVTSVWTFDFQIQNCTERLGCPSSRRTNRFKNYRACMGRCQSLVDLYMQILAYDGKNNTYFVLRSEGIPGRREGSDSILSTPTSEEYEDEASGDEAINTQLVYGDGDEDTGDESVKLPDIPDLPDLQSVCAQLGSGSDVVYKCAVEKVLED